MKLETAKVIATVQELRYYDMVFCYHLLKVNDTIELIKDGTDLKGDFRYSVWYNHFRLGYVILGGYFKSYYETAHGLHGKIISINKEKLSMIRDMDIEVELTNCEL